MVYALLLLLAFFFNLIFFFNYATPFLERVSLNQGVQAYLQIALLHLMQ